MSFSIVWDTTEQRKYETGIDRVVLYLADDSTNPTYPYQDGVAWNGVTAINQSSSGGESSPLFADNIKYLNLMSMEDISFSIEAYARPDEFGYCDGTRTLVPGLNIFQQVRKSFGFSYRTMVGSALSSSLSDYKIHIIYNCMASPTERAYQTTNDSPEPTSYNWNVSTNSVNLTGYKPFAQIVIDSKTISEKELEALEAILYGDSDLDIAPRLPLPSDILEILGFDDLLIVAADPEYSFDDMNVSDIQNNITISDNSISGELLSTNWVWDAFNFETSETTGPHYYIALDFTNNNYSLITACHVGTDLTDLRKDLMVTNNRICFFEVYSNEDVLYVLQQDPHAEHLQSVNFTNVTFS